MKEEEEKAMIPKISLITAIAGAALALAVPAWGDNWGADQRAAQEETSNMLDVHERALAPISTWKPFAAKNESAVASDFYADGFAQAVLAAGVRTAPVRDDGFRIDYSDVPVPVSATSSGRELEWPQIGIGFGVGVILMLGLYVALRYTRIRPLPH